MSEFTEDELARFGLELDPYSTRGRNKTSEQEYSEVEELKKEIERLKAAIIANTDCVCGDFKCDECPR